MSHLSQNDRAAGRLQSLFSALDTYLWLRTNAQLNETDACTDAAEMHNVRPVDLARMLLGINPERPDARGLRLIAGE